MPLDFAEFARFYQGQGLSEQQQRVKFEPFADFMECISRAYWPHGTGRNPLGITLDVNSLSAADTVDSTPSITFSFNAAASIEPAGKKDS